MGGTHAKETNLDKITKKIIEETPKKGKSLMVSVIPKTSLWIVGEKNSKNKWKISICNPKGTTSRLVSKNKTEEDYYHVWRLLTTIQLPDTIKHAVHEAKKHVQQLIQNKIINQ